MRKFQNKVQIIVLAIIFILTTIFGVSYSIVSGQDEVNKPSFKAEIQSLKPNPAYVGEDVTVTGVIKPQPFEMEIPEKDIILVLDVSGSMNEYVYINDICQFKRYKKYCTRYHLFEEDHINCDRRWHKDYWKYDYCPYHDKEGNHEGRISSTKIQELKKATIAFIEKMKNEKNLNIAIVTFSKEANIETKHDERGKTNYFYSSDDSRLLKIVNDLYADGGTNTGEGLRKASYALSTISKNNKNTNKAVVMMSDGVPTYYSRKDTIPGDYYLDLNDNKPPIVAGTGNSVSEYTIGYSNLMGKELKKYVNSAFSIGYGLGDENSRGNKILNDIHVSMGGEKDKFYASSEGAIEGIFSDIADEIKASYSINEVSMNINIEGDAISIPDGPTIDIGTVQYKTDGEIKNGKLKYMAEDIPFSFVIKGEKVGEYDFKGKIETKFPWNNETESKVEIFNTGKITFLDNDLPNIEAKLISSEVAEGEIGEEINVSYDIIPNSFNFNDETNKLIHKDIIFVVDTGSASYDLKHFWSGGLLKDKENQVGLISYNKEVNVVQGLSANSSPGNSDNIFDKLKQAETGDGNIGLALTEADNEFKRKGKSGSDKYIILISSGNLSYNDEQINCMKNQGYNFISLKLANNDSGDLSKLHEILGGSDSDYFYSSDKNINQIVKKIDEQLSLKRYSKYVFNDVKLNLNIGEEFDVISSDLKKVENNTKCNYELKIPSIEYKAKNQDGSVTYSAEKQTVSFKVVPKINGELGFNPNNTISYTNLLGDKLVERSIRTPKVFVNSNLSHGVYEGFKNGEHRINESSLTFPREASVTFAGSIEIGNRDIDIKLDIDKAIKLQKNKDGQDVMPKVYEVKADGELELIGNMTKNKDSYILNVKKYDNSEGKLRRNIIIIYNTDLPSKAGTFTNKITVGKIEKDASIIVKDEGLPDLF